MWNKSEIKMEDATVQADKYQKIFHFSSSTQAKILKKFPEIIQIVFISHSEFHNSKMKNRAAAWIFEDGFGEVIKT